ncbi:unnamed protein product [Paramecium pentaurelia]|uniref:SAM domain-containing protein n=1 Tax=Paramecium pentaurelia TaxID=43138 RepID=A0A8S1V0T5_9CILI|nr:unnamed protein product [Paramecium pentaurelia]
MLINQELKFDSKLSTNYKNLQSDTIQKDEIEKLKLKNENLQQNIIEMHQQQEVIKNALIEPQSRLKNNLSFIDDSKDQFNETKKLDANIPINQTKLSNSLNKFLDLSISTQESQYQIQSLKFQPIASFLIDIQLKEHYLQNFIDLRIYDNVSLYNSLPSINQCKYLLNKYGIDRLGFQRRILFRLDEQMGLFSKNNLVQNLELYYNQIPTIKEWLESINYQHYYYNFKLAGYDNFKYLIYQEHTQYQLSLSDFKEQFSINNESDSKLILANLIIICDNIKNLNTFNVQTSKKVIEQDICLVQCALPNNKCVIF